MKYGIFTVVASAFILKSMAPQKKKKKKAKQIMNACHNGFAV